MPLAVTERQITKQWYELSGDLAASEIFPKLLPNSESFTEADGIETEPEEDAGRYDGCPQGHEEMENEIAEFTKSAIAEFHDEALNAAKVMLSPLLPGQTLFWRDFEDAEYEILEEAAKALGIAVPWDPAEAAQIAAEQAASHARSIVYAQKELAHWQSLLDKNAAAIERAKEQNKPERLAEEERLRPRRIERVEEARRQLETLLTQHETGQVVPAPA